MSKTGKVFMVLGIILLVAIIGVVILVMSVNKEKTSITAETFKSIMENKGYTILDAKYQFAEYDFVQKVYLAMKENYQIEFYEMQDNQNAVDFYNNNVNIAEQSKATSSANTQVNGKNYNKYTLSSNGKYKVISRINNTVVYLNVDTQYKDSVKTILDELGY